MNKISDEVKAQLVLAAATLAASTYAKSGTTSTAGAGSKMRESLREVWNAFRNFEEQTLS